MSAGHKALIARRARLVERADAQRDDLARQLAPWRRRLGVVDRGLAIARGAKRAAPVLGLGIGVGMAALAIMRPAGLGGWLRRGQAVWQAIGSLRRGAARVSAGRATPAAEIAAGPEK